MAFSFAKMHMYTKALNSYSPHIGFIVLMQN
jgi:hypothetical protein